MKFLLFFLLPTVAFCNFIPPSIFNDQLNNIQINCDRADEELVAEYKLIICKPLHKKWVSYLGGKVTTDCDMFGTTIKTNVFTTIGVDF